MPAPGTRVIRVSGRCSKIQSCKEAVNPVSLEKIPKLALMNVVSHSSNVNYCAKKMLFDRLP